MTGPAAWWRGLSDSDRYRFYTRLSLQTAVLVPLVIVVQDVGAGAVVALGVSAAIAVVAIDAEPVMRLTSLRWPAATVPLTAAALVTVLVAAGLWYRLADGAFADDAPAVSALSAFYLAAAVLAFRRRRWQLVAAVGALTGVLLGQTWTQAALGVLISAAVCAVACGISLVTWWGLRVIDDLEEAQAAQARLQVAEERLRFSRDLHDVVGRGFSAIAVKSELAATLARAGHPDRSAGEMDEVKSLAVESMDQMRALVRGYREISLEAEVAGARSLLSAAGCRLEVEGDADRVPQRFHEAAAWVVREGTTNIVKHSAAGRATLVLGASGMTLRNDVAGEAAASDADPSGHRGLRERLAAVGATMSTHRRDGEYVLEVRWGDDGPPGAGEEDR